MRLKHRFPGLGDRDLNLGWTEKVWNKQVERKGFWPSVTELRIIMNTQEMSTTTPDFSSSFKHNKLHTALGNRKSGDLYLAST